MVQFRTRVYDKVDNAGFVGADVIIQSDTDVEKVVTITDDSRFTALANKVENLNKYYVPFATNSNLKEVNIDTILKNTSNDIAINAKTLGSKPLSYFSPLNHTHQLTDITNLYKYEIKIVDANNNEKYNVALGEKITLEFRVYNAVTGKGVSNVNATIKSIPDTILPEQSLNTNSNGLARARNITLSMSGVVTFVITTPSSIETVQCFVNDKYLNQWVEKDIGLPTQLPMSYDSNTLMDVSSTANGGDRNVFLINEYLGLAQLSIWIPAYKGFNAENTSGVSGSIENIFSNIGKWGNRTYSYDVVIPEEYLPYGRITAPTYQSDFIFYVSWDGTINAYHKSRITTSMQVRLSFMWHYIKRNSLEQPNKYSDNEKDVLLREWTIQV